MQHARFAGIAAQGDFGFLQDRRLSGLGLQPACENLLLFGGQFFDDAQQGAGDVVFQQVFEQGQLLIGGQGFYLLGKLGVHVAGFVWVRWGH